MLREKHPIQDIEKVCKEFEYLLENKSIDWYVMWCIQVWFNRQKIKPQASELLSEVESSEECKHEWKDWGLNWKCKQCGEIKTHL